MAEISGFFNSINGDRRYRAERFAKYFGRFIKNGYFPESDTSLKVFENYEMTTVFKVGAAYINGYDYEATSDIVKSHDIADGVLHRIDRIVLRLNYANREILSHVKKGVPSSNPVAPELQRDADIYELCIADVYIRAGATEINQLDITDQRKNSNLCGVVNNLFAQEDSSAANITIADIYDLFESNNVEDALTMLAKNVTLNNVFRSNKNEFGVWKTVEEKRTDGTLARKLTLSNPDANGNLQTQIIEYYDRTGQKLLLSDPWKITYDDYGDPMNEVRV